MKEPQSTTVDIAEQLCLSPEGMQTFPPDHWAQADNWRPVPPRDHVAEKVAATEAIIGRTITDDEMPRMALQRDSDGRLRVKLYDRPTIDPERRNLYVWTEHEPEPSRPDYRAAARWNARVHNTPLALELTSRRPGTITPSQPRQRSSHRGRPGHRRTRSTRGPPAAESDSDGPGDAGPQRRAVVVDDHYLVEAVVA